MSKHIISIISICIILSSMMCIKTDTNVVISNRYIMDVHEEKFYTQKINYVSSTDINIKLDIPVKDEIPDNGDTTYSIGMFKLTAYCPCMSCSEGYGISTATGVTATSGRTVAVDPKVIKYGTHLLINDIEYVAEDCGGGVKGNHIDIFFDTHEEVEKFGRQYEEVFIIRRN